MRAGVSGMQTRAWELRGAAASRPLGWILRLRSAPAEATCRWRWLAVAEERRGIRLPCLAPRSGGESELVSLARRADDANAIVAVGGLLDLGALEGPMVGGPIRHHEMSARRMHAMRDLVRRHAFEGVDHEAVEPSKLADGRPPRLSDLPQPDVARWIVHVEIDVRRVGSTPLAQKSPIVDIDGHSSNVTWNR
jgi:hypothetical protein